MEEIRGGSCGVKEVGVKGEGGRISNQRCGWEGRKVMSKGEGGGRIT